MLELSLHILDVAENSTRAGAKLVQINVIEDEKKDLLSIEIRDNGSGMSEDVIQKALDPFFTTKTVRDVGLGLPMLAQAAERTGGGMAMESKAGEGTRVLAEFRLSHIDRQPLGNIASTMATLIAGNPDVDFIYRHQRNARKYVLDTRVIRKEMGELSFENPMAFIRIRKHVEAGLKQIETQA